LKGIRKENDNDNFRLPPIHKANPAIASTAISTSIADIINMALPNFHVALLFVRAAETLDQVDRDGI
jgi:hypothetical protein